MSSYEFAEFESSSTTQNGKTETRRSGKLKRKRNEEEPNFYLINPQGNFVEVDEQRYMKAPSIPQYFNTFTRTNRDTFANTQDGSRLVSDTEPINESDTEPISESDKYEYSIVDNEYAYPSGYNMFSVSNINRYFSDEMPKLFKNGFNDGNFRR